jgi:hypothetical protein
MNESVIVVSFVWVNYLGDAKTEDVMLSPLYHKEKELCYGVFRVVRRYLKEPPGGT